jgi:hypothetical protein
MKPRRAKLSGSGSADVLAARIAAARDECHRAVEVLSSRRPLSDAKLAECARLGDSLDATHRFLKFAVAQIAITRRKRETAKID